MIGIYCPTFGRPHALQRLADNIAFVTVEPYHLLFVVEAHDDDSGFAAAATGEGMLVNQGEPSYSNALQTAFDLDDADLFLAANDDFDFHPGWDTHALTAMTEGTAVVGVNDGAPGCAFSTIALVRRSYILEQSGVIDMPGRVFYPYQHNFVDTEFHATAAARGVFAAAPDSVICHKHPDWGYVERDHVYLKGRASFADDQRVFQSRRHLWEGARLGETIRV